MDKKKASEFEKFQQRIFQEYMNKDLATAVECGPPFLKGYLRELLYFCFIRVDDLEDIMTSAGVTEKFIVGVGKIKRKEGEASWSYPNKVKSVYLSIVKNRIKNPDKRPRMRKIGLNEMELELVYRDAKNA